MYPYQNNNRGYTHIQYMRETINMRNKKDLWPFRSAGLHRERPRPVPYVRLL